MAGAGESIVLAVAAADHSRPALPAENLTGWYQGMQQLQQLTQRLDALDEQKENT